MMIGDHRSLALRGPKPRFCARIATMNLSSLASLGTTKLHGLVRYASLTRMYDESSAIITRHGKKEKVWPQPAGKSHPAGSRGTCRPGGRHRLGGPEQCPISARHSRAHAAADPGGSPGTELSSHFPGKIVAPKAHLNRWTYHLGDRGCLRLPGH